MQGLAGQTARATEEIGRQIAAIQAATAEAVTGLERMAEGLRPDAVRLRGAVGETVTGLRAA